MQKFAQKIIRHPLISGSAIVFIGSFIANIGNYLFNLAMGRLLPVSEYGMLLSIVAVIGLLTVFQSASTTIFAKLSAKFSASGDTRSLNALKMGGIKVISLMSVTFFVILVLLTLPINSFLHLDNWKLWLIASVSLIFSLLSSFTVGMLQGQLRFMFLSLLNIVAVITKLIFGIGLVLLGAGVGGGVTAFIAYFSIPFLVALPFVFPKRHTTREIDEGIFFKEFKRYSLPFLFASLGTTFLLSGDVILARHFLSPTASGQFAALSLMGKAIFYLTTPIYFAFFPIIAQKKEKKEKLLGTLILASVIITGASTFLSFIYFAFPGIVVHLFFPSNIYQATIPYLGLFSLYVMVFSIAFLLNSYFLSIGKTGVWKIDIITCGIFILLFSLFHQGFGQIIAALFATSVLLLIMLCIYYKANGPH